MQFFPTRTDPAEHRGRLSIHHDAPGQVESIDLRGTGVQDGVVTDLFEQLEGPKVDILWVIDDSCSMIDEQARLVGNLNQFVGYADQVNASYQMAVTTTDGLSSGAGRFERCFPHPAIISKRLRDQRGPRGSLRVHVSWSATAGAFVEAGLGAAKLALDRAQDPNLSPNLNRGFLRPDASLAIVTMSDEDDQSILSDVVLRDYFLSLKRYRQDRVAVHAIAGPVAEACDTGIFNARPGFRYYWMTREDGRAGSSTSARKTGKPLLRDLGLDVFVPVDEWDLSQAAEGASIAVLVDGVPVPASTADGFTYELRGNTVKFHGSAVPSSGAQIEVTYRGLCRP